MIRKLNFLSIFLIALLASLGTASTASAGALFSELLPVTLQGEQVTQNVFTFTNDASKTLKCKVAKVSGNLTETTSTPSLHPEFGECEAFGYPEAFTTHVITTGCNYRFHVGETIGVTGRYDATFDLECEAGKAIVITVGGCEVKIDPQQALSTVEFANVAGIPGDIAITWSVQNISYTVVKSATFACSLSGVGTKPEGDLTGTTTVSAQTKSGQPVGLKIVM